MDKKELLLKLKLAVLEGEDDSAKNLAEKCIEAEIIPSTIFEEAISLGIYEAGELWKRNEYFHTDVILSAEAFRIAMEVIEPHMKAGEASNVGRVLIGTVAGDMHNLGKTMVIATLRSVGFEVVDLGEDVPNQTFLEKVKELKPNILGLGCYMTTTMDEIPKIINDLTEQGLRNDVKVLVGGVPTTQEFIDEIKADGWGKDAFDTMEKAKELMGVK